jgi:methionyl-tRNA formyltransferase
MPELGTFNLHASSLTIVVLQINWAIINGETKQVTTFFDDRLILVR